MKIEEKIEEKTEKKVAKKKRKKVANKKRKKVAKKKRKKVAKKKRKKKLVATRPLDTSESPPAPRKTPSPHREAELVVPEPDPNNWRFLRFAAGVYYTQDLNDCSLPDLRRHPQFSVIPQRTLEEWCRRDHWTRRRREHKEMLRQRIAAQVGDKLAQARVRQLEQLQSIYDLGIDKIESKLLDAKSWEGVVNALTKLAQLMDDFREKISHQVVPVSGEYPGAQQAAHAGPPKALQTRLTPEEAEAFAKALIQTRREKLSAPRDEDEED